MECGIKVVRKYQADYGLPERYRIITFEGAFHGRTLATSPPPASEYLEGFGPTVEGFDHVPFEQPERVREKIGPETAAILVEPVQGEGGVRPPRSTSCGPARAVRRVRPAAAPRRGPERHGPHRQALRAPMGGRQPDVMATAKGIGGGFPLGACLATGKVAAALATARHGTTFGGNPLAMAVGNAVLDVMLAPGFLDRGEEVARGLAPAARACWSTSIRRSSRTCAARGCCSASSARLRTPTWRRAARAGCSRSRRRQRRAPAAAADHRWEAAGGHEALQASLDTPASRRRGPAPSEQARLAQ